MALDDTLDDSRRGERRETINELSDLLHLAQEMGRRLANETHGSSYAYVEELNRLLHQTRSQLNRIEGRTEGSVSPDSQDERPPEPVALSKFGSIDTEHLAKSLLTPELIAAGAYSARAGGQFCYCPSSCYQPTCPRAALTILAASHPKVAPQRRPRIAAAEAVGTQRDEAAVLRDVGAHAFRHCAHVVGGGDDGAGAALQLLFDERHGFCRITRDLALQTGTAVTGQFAPAGHYVHGHIHALSGQQVGGLDDLGQNGARAQQRHILGEYGP